MLNASRTLVFVIALSTLVVCGSCSRSGSNSTSKGDGASTQDSTSPATSSTEAKPTLPSNELTPRPPKIGKTQSIDVVLAYEDDSWGFWLHDTAKNSNAPFWLSTPESSLATWAIQKLIPEPKPQESQVKVGTVRWPSVVYAGRILTTEALYQDFSSQYGADFDVQLIKLPVSWFPARTGDKDFSEALEAIQIQLVFEESTQGNPVIQDVFPKTSFEDEGWKITGKVGVGIGGFQKRAGIEADARANVGVSFDYTPLVARVVADGIGNQATFRIKEVKDRQPVGQIDYYCTVLVPRTLRQSAAELTVTLWFSESQDRFLELPPQKLEIDFGRQAE